MLNAGKYNKRIQIYRVQKVKGAAGIQTDAETLILETYAAVKTTKGFSIIVNNSDFEKAYTNFTIRYSDTVMGAYYDSDVSNRDMFVRYNGKEFSVQYLRNVDEDNVEIEIQAKEVLH